MTSKSAKKSSLKPKSRVKKGVKRVVKKAVKRKISGKSVRQLKATMKALPKEVLDWVKENHGQEAARAAVEKFGVSYAHVTDWLKKEGVQVRDAVGTLIESRKKEAFRKAEEKLNELSRKIDVKKKELEQLNERLKTASRKM